MENGVLAQSEQERNDLWALRENISVSQRSLDTNIKHDIALPIVRIAAFVRRCTPILKVRFADIEIACFGHLGNGSLHYNAFPPKVMSNDIYEYEDVINTVVYEDVLQDSDTIAAEHGIDTIKKHWSPRVCAESELALIHAMKAHLNPHNIMNPGKLLP